MQRKRVGGKRKAKFQPIDTQPEPDTHLTVHRAYSTHTLSSNYKRRISWIGNPDKTTPKIGVAEYIGTFPGRAAHGNSKITKENI